MKLFPLIAAAVNAQNINLPDLSNFDLSAFGLAPDAFNVQPAAAAGPADGERYFFTAATTTTVTTTTVTVPPVIAGTSCFKCDKMSYATCGSQGRYQICPSGDFDCCFVEVRETKTELKQLCTGCKDKTACEDNKAENFQGINSSTHQCRPDYRQQRVGQRGPQTSVCRQCFMTCDPAVDPNKCFGSVALSNDLNMFRLGFSTNQANYPWNGHFKGSDTQAMGIPTLGSLDATTDAVVITAIEGKATLLNVYFDNFGDGKDHITAGDGARDSTLEMTFWAVQGASMSWWMSDLKSIQMALNNHVGAQPTVAIAASEFA